MEIKQKQKKAFEISKEEVSRAWNQVYRKGGKGGIDGETIKSFREKKEKYLYKLWNRMSSGSYIPKAVLRVEIPKTDGGRRQLGIPTITDRIAQQVVRARLEEKLEPIFHEDSYGYRPNKSAQEAVGKCRERCWKCDWVLDIDISKFFDTIDHELMMKAVRHHCDEQWMILYIERWLKAPVQEKNGEIKETSKGTPQGGVISPLLANLYLHYSFDLWMTREFSEIKFERYADDAVIHCTTEAEAERVQEALIARLKECGLSLHPKKTKIVYCKDGKRKRTYPEKRFRFLGYTFEARSAKNSYTGEKFTRFLPAMSKESGKKFRNKLREGKYFKRTQNSVEHLSREISAITQGFYNYFTKYYKSSLYRLNDWLDESIVRWYKRKHKSSWKRAWSFLRRLKKQRPNLFKHWNLLRS